MLTLCFSMIALLTFAQGTGKIIGTVTDGTGRTMAGVSVRLIGTSIGVSTDVDGKYNLQAAATKTAILEFSYMGYATKQITDVAIQANELTNLNVILDPSDATVLEQVVITASFKKESINALYAKQKNSASISDGISAESIRRSPDRNTSDVLKRVSGATVQDNKFVVIRGLSDRYNTALLDGATLPSTEPNRKAFSFDIVPSNLVDNIIVNKTATPDLPGDFAGGVVHIQTKDIPDRNFVSIGLGSSYNTASTFKDFKSGKRNFTDYLGFDNGDKSLPANFPTTNQIIGGLTPEQNIAALKLLPSDWNIYDSKALPNLNGQFTLGRTKTFENSGNKLGALVALTYRNGHQINSDVFRKYYEHSYTDNIYKFSSNLGAIANFGYTFGKSKITFKNIYNRIYEDQFLSREGSNQGTQADIKFFAFDLIQKSLLKSTVEGNHSIGADNSKLDWSLSYSNVKNSQPDQRKVNYMRLFSDAGSPENYIYKASITTLGKENTRLFSELNENVYSAAVNYSKPLNLFNQSANLKAGLSTQYRDRSFDIRFIGQVIRFNDEEVRSRPLNTLFGSDLINNNIYKLDEVPNDLDSYQAHSLTNAGYIMLDNRFGEKSRIVWGARLEHFNVSLDAKVPSPSTSVDQSYFDVLPSVNYTYSLTDKINLRASYYRTLARPEFRELAISSYFDYELMAFIQGNPNIKRSLIDNADIRFEFYPQSGQILSVSAFYKKFHNAIESFNMDAASTRIVEFRNSDEVTAYGVELEARKSLEFIADKEYLKNTTLYTNLSLIKSKVVNENTGLNLIDVERPMVGQAPYVINAGLQHDFLNRKLSFNALYNVVGRRLNIASGGVFPSVWEAPRNVIDLQLGVKVLKDKGELKFNAGDILNQATTLYYDTNLNKKYDAAADQTLGRFKIGSTYSVSFNYTF